VFRRPQLEPKLTCNYSKTEGAPQLATGATKDHLIRVARWRTLINTGIVIGGTVLSRVLGLMREAIFSRRFGTLPEFGAFTATFTILDVLYLVIIGGALGSALIPVFSRLMQEDQEERAWELANTVLSLAFVVFVVLAGVVAIFARPLLAFSVARGYAGDPHLLDIAVHLLRLMLVQPLLLGLGGLMMALLQSFERFTLPAIAFNVYNLAIIAAALVLAPMYARPQDAVQALAWGVVAGALLYLLVMLPGVVRAGLRFKPAFNWRLPEVVRVGRLMAPRLIGQAALQINIIIMTALIGYLSASAQAANRYAFQLLMLPHGILAISLGTVMFPRLTRLFAAGKLDELRQVSLQTLRIVLWLTVPAAVILAVLHVPILRLLFQGGRFDQEALRLTARALLFYTPGAIGLAGAEIVIRTFYAMENTRTPVLVGVVTIALNAVLARVFISLTRDIGLIAFAYSLANMLEFVVLFGLLGRRLGGFGDTRLLRSILVLGPASLALFLTLIASVWLSRDSVPGVTFNSPYGRSFDFLALAGWLGVVGTLSFGVYLAVGALMRAPEAHEVWALLRRRREG
jgi:putative peptidoglycan lipid II flippase